MNKKKKVKKVEKTQKEAEKAKKRDIKKYLLGKKKDIIRKIKELKRPDDYGALKEFVGEMLMYGIPLGSVISFIFNTPYIGTVLVVGSCMFLFDKKLLYMVVQVLSSIKLVQINR